MTPSLFVSHGAPTVLLDASPARDFFTTELAGHAPQPTAILVVSAHWDTAAPMVSAPAANRTIYDFYGFPDDLYRLTYPAPPAPALARQAALLTGAGIDTDRGLDHGAWIPLLAAWPQADVPVAQLSIQARRDAAWHLDLGRQLAPLRRDGVLILGSGAVTHNLRGFFGQAVDAPAADWSDAFADWLSAAALAGDTEALSHWERAPHAQRNHPSWEHLAPFFVAYGAAMGADGTAPNAQRIHASAAHSVLRMDAYRFDA